MSYECASALLIGGWEGGWGVMSFLFMSSIGFEDDTTTFARVSRAYGIVRSQCSKFGHRSSGQSRPC